MTATPHDALFKATFSQPERAAEELRCVLPPALLARMDLSSLSLEPGSFIAEDLRARHTDLLFSVLLDGRPARIYILFEHQSSDEPWMPLRLLHYMLRIWDDHLAEAPADTRRLPVIIPVVLHHGDAGWRSPTRFEALVDPPPEAAPFTPHFGFLLDDLNNHSELALHERTASAFTKLTLLALRQTRGACDLTRLLNSWSTLIDELARTPNGPAALRLIFHYIFQVQGPAAFAAVDIDAIEINEGGKQIMESMAQYLHRTGRDEGRVTGRRELFITMTRHRFGALSPAQLERIESADDPTLERWSLRLLTAQSLADLFADE